MGVTPDGKMVQRNSFSLPSDAAEAEAPVEYGHESGSPSEDNLNQSGAVSSEHNTGAPGNRDTTQGLHGIEEETG